MNPTQIKQFIAKSRQQGISDGETLTYLKQKGVDLTPKEPSKVGGFVKSLVSAPLTMLARPVQAVAELAGVSDQAVNDFSKNKLGGFVAPTPQNGADVKKDVGRAVETVAFGAGGLATAGAAFGVGSSLEQGNDLFSLQTALQGTLGAAGGKVLGLIGKPIFNVAGKVIGEITPKYLSDIVAKGSTAITDFAAQHEILPSFVKTAEKAVSDKLSAVGTVAKDAIKTEMKPVADFASKIKNKISPSTQGVIDKRITDLQSIEDQKVTIRNFSAKQTAKGFDPKKDIASTDLITNSVDNTGTIRTKQAGGAIDQYNEFIKPQEAIVNKVLKQEGTTIPLSQVETEMKNAVNSSSIKGSAKTTALNNIKKEIAGLRLDADAQGNIPVATIHEAKVSKYANINYNNPESGGADKLIAKTLKQIVEDNSSANIKSLNAELSRHYANIGYLEKLDGAKVANGKLGKHFKQVIGGMIGSHFGPLGTIAGAEIAGKLAGAEMSSTFSKTIGKDLESSQTMKDALQSLKKDLPLKTNQSTTKINTTQVISPKSTTSSLKVKGTIPENSLISEAKKYKSAEDYINSKATYFTGGKQEISQFGELGKNKIGQDKQGVFLTSSDKYAKIFAGKDGKITQVFADIKKPFKVTNENMIEAPQSYLEYIQELKDKGYDSLLLKKQKFGLDNKGVHDQLLVLDPSVLKTKSQLIEIWQKANNKVK